MSKSLEQKKIEQIENLPTLPEVANKLLKIINDPTTTAVDVANLISRDLSLTSKVLRLANSAFYGIPRTVTTVQNAVVILGLKVINTMVFSITVVKMFPGDGRNELFSRKKFWAHSLACAVLARQLALRMRKFTLFDPEECFCAGLIHDIGRVVLDQYFHENFLKAIQTAIRQENPPAAGRDRDLRLHPHGRGRLADLALGTAAGHPRAHRPPPHARQDRIRPRDHHLGAPGRQPLLRHRFRPARAWKRRPPVDDALIAQLGFTQEDLDAVKASAAEEIEKFQAAFEI